MGLIGCPETTVWNYHYSLRNSPEERSSQVPIYFHALDDDSVKITRTMDHNSLAHYSKGLPDVFGLSLVPTAVEYATSPPRHQSNAPHPTCLPPRGSSHNLSPVRIRQYWNPSSNEVENHLSTVQDRSRGCDGFPQTVRDGTIYEVNNFKEQ